jgi:hypothetical protein
MTSTLRTERVLYQEVAVADIEKRFGSEVVYTNPNGNLAITKQVLTAFRSLTDGWAVWDRSERAWRVREAYDSPGRVVE